MKTDDWDLMCGLPGEPLVRQGLADLQSGKQSVPACLVSIARSRLARAGLLDCSTPPALEPELQLYRLLRREGGDAYSRYNSLLRELISFEQALDRRTSRLSNES
jgi:hypothetical protein